VAIIDSPTLTARGLVPCHWRTGGPIKLAGDTRYLNLPNRSIRRRVEKGDFEAVGSPARVRRQDLDDFIERSRIKPGALVHGPA